MEPKSRRASRQSDNQKIPIRLQSAVYATGTFATASEFAVQVILPLWALALGASPFMIGVILGARHFLTMLLSIHGGAVMDRIGARRVLIGCGVIAIMCPWLYPTLPFVWAAIILQMIGGLASNYGWIGAQAQIGDLMKGSPAYAGRLSFSVRFGQLLAPPTAGYAWDVGGEWTAFGVLSLWGVGFFLSSLFLPRREQEPPPGSLKTSDLLPRIGDYVDAFRLLAVPTILMVVIVSVLRMAGNGMQVSFYIVYLQQLGYTGSLIGLLVSAAGLLGFAGALSITPLSRIIPPFTLLLASVAAGIFLITITPVIGGVFALLLLASGLRGGALGLGQPLMVSILAGAAGAGNQGKAIGLRTTANRLISMLIPMIMGGVVEVAGIEASFLIVGFVLIAITGLVAWRFGSVTSVTPEP